MSHSVPLFRKAVLSPEQSDTIRVARVICLLSMVTVHFWPGATRILEQGQPTAAHPFYALMVDYLGRSSVPLLSMVSGGLMVMSMRRLPATGGVIRKKFDSLIRPMVVWSAILLAVYVLGALANGDWSRVPSDPMGWINAVFALNAEPANLPLAFLRDSFVCSVVAVVALKLGSRPQSWAQLAAMALPVVVLAFAYRFPDTVLLRPQIGWFYAAGVILALTGAWRLSPPWLLVAGMLVIQIAMRNGMIPEPIAGFSGLLDRVTMSVVVWKLCESLVHHAPGLHQRLVRLEPLMFTLFCSHMLAVTAVAVAARALHLSETSDSYIFIFLLQYPASLGLALAIDHLRGLINGKAMSRNSRIMKQ